MPLTVFSVRGLFVAEIFGPDVRSKNGDLAVCRLERDAWAILGRSGAASDLSRMVLSTLKILPVLCVRGAVQVNGSVPPACRVSGYGAVETRRPQVPQQTSRE